MTDLPSPFATSSRATRSFHLGETFVKNDLHAVLELSRRTLVVPGIANPGIGVLRSFEDCRKMAKNWTREPAIFAIFEQPLRAVATDAPNRCDRANRQARIKPFIRPSVYVKDLLGSSLRGYRRWFMKN